MEVEDVGGNGGGWGRTLLFGGGGGGGLFIPVYDVLVDKVDEQDEAPEDEAEADKRFAPFWT